jgi:Cu+-exporting ATPase
VAVSLADRTAEVHTRGPLSALLRATATAGYPATFSAAPASPDPPPPRAAPSTGTTTTLLRVRRMSCGACASAVERAARRVRGVASASVSLLAGTAIITWQTPPPPRCGTPADVAAAVAAAGYSCEVCAEDAARRAAFKVTGVCCAACPPRIAAALQVLPGVGEVGVLQPGTGEDLIDALSSRPPGPLPFLKVTVAFDAAEVGPRALRDALLALGYGAEPWVERGGEDDGMAAALAEAAEWRRLFLGSLAFTAPLVVLMMLLPYIPACNAALMRNLLPTPPPQEENMPMSARSLPLMSVLAAALATPVQFGYGWRFARGAARALRSGGANMDVLVACGTGAAYLYSVLLVLLRALRPQGASGKDMFDTPAMLLTFILLGKWLESRARGATASALRSLAQLQPPRALLVTLDAAGAVATETDIAAALLQPGDLLKLAAGDRVPADGVLHSGAVAFDESLLTGESVPVLRKAGERCAAGALAVAGAGIMAAESVGADTGLARIVALVRDAQAAKAPVQAKADGVASVFVPAVLALAVITFCAWFGACRTGVVPLEWYASEGAFLFSFLFALAALVIACPCALGLATPTAVMVACGAGARRGLLFKGGAPLQAAAGVTTVAFDKTGTLTAGAPSLAHTELLAGPRDMEWALAAAAAMEAGSTHPLARAILAAAVQAAQRRGANLLPLLPDQPEHISTVLGRGVCARLGSEAVALGAPDWHSPALSPAAAERVAALEAAGHTVLLLCAGPAVCSDDGCPQEDPEALAAAAANGGAIALFALIDRIKPDAAEAVTALNAAGVACVMLSGDNARTAAAVAAAVGITDVRAGLLPAQKVEAVASLRGAGARVAMVGDGVNDAPALAAADVGIAIGAGADVAIDAAGVVLVHSRVLDVPAALQLAAVTMRRIKVNLILSLAFNCLGIPLAAGALYPAARVRLPPEAAAAAMAASSVAVVVSSLLLRRWHSPHFAADTLERGRSDVAAPIDRRHRIERE